MGYVSINAYDADVRVPQFTGLMQYGEPTNPCFATETNNADTPAGVLQPFAAPTVMQYDFQSSRIETLMHLYRRWYTGSGSKEVIFAAVGGSLYRLTSSGWTALSFPTGISSYQSNVWSWVAYEINPQGSTSSVDVLLISNAKDGMFMINGNDFTVSAVETPKKFGVIERYAERIWGGAIEDDPDMLVYSAPYDPTDWEANVEIPEDGAGDILQPSWDGDSFTALRAFGSQLIAFKKNRVWRVLGTDPGEYTFKEQYGGGAPFFNTIAVDAERILMAGKDGVQSYDGLSVTDFQKQYIEDFWKTVNKNAMDQMCGVLYKDKYYLAVPTGNSTVNNALVVYNRVDGTWLTTQGISIESFLATEEGLYATSATLPGKMLVVNTDSWATGVALNAPTLWVSPWLDFNYRRMTKGGFELYFTCEVQDDPVELKFSIQSEKKIKTKRYTVNPLTESQLSANKNYRQKKLHFGGAGRRFRFIIETDGGTAPWRLISGIQLRVEVDND